MYLPDADITNDFHRFAFEQQQRYRNSQSYFPHFCDFIFKLYPSDLNEEGYVESNAIIADNVPWKVFIQAGGKELYPFLNVGIVDHNKVEEISFKIILKGIKPEYNEKRQQTLKIDDLTNPKLLCDEKIWHRSLFDIPENPGDPEKPLIFEVVIEFRLPGETFKFNHIYDRIHSSPTALDRPRSEDFPRGKDIPQWYSGSSDFDDADFVTNASVLTALIYFGLLYFCGASFFNINFFSLSFQLICYLLSFIFTLIFFISDILFWILYFPVTQFTEILMIFNFFSFSQNLTSIDPVSSTSSFSFELVQKFVDEE